LNDIKLYALYILDIYIQKVTVKMIVKIYFRVESLLNHLLTSQLYTRNELKHLRLIPTNTSTFKYNYVFSVH